MFHIVLYEPEIPPNTGNIIRLCANSGSQLHLVGPLGFELDDKRLRRAGLDYGEWASVKTYTDLDTCIDAIQPRQVFALSTRGTTLYTEAQFQEGDVLLFGPETRGLPQAVLDSLQPGCDLRIPMVSDSRSLNLSNTAAIVLYTAWQQLGFQGGR